ncbi:MAG: tyrosine recombinase XerD, partial [Sphingobacteriales bacterium]
MWEAYIKGFKAYLQLERNLSANTIDAYLHDIALLAEFVRLNDSGKAVESIALADLQSFLMHINELEFASCSQARIISGIKAFFRYLLLEEVIRLDPTAF